MMFIGVLINLPIWSTVRGQLDEGQLFFLLLCPKYAFLHLTLYIQPLVLTQDQVNVKFQKYLK